MYRRSNSTGSGGSFDQFTIQQVWQKGRAVQGFDPSYVRMDACGKLIERLKYGQTDRYGWEIDHVHPVALGGQDNLSNLQPLHWQNNRHKSDSWPTWTCAVTGN